ncbi:MAG: tetratricopeptide repeat protein, partial [Planctomycetota bacterium]
MTRATAATALGTLVGLLAAWPTAARGAERTRVAVLGERDAGWQSEGLARAVLAHLARAEGVVPANPVMAGRLVQSDADAEAAAGAAGLLHARWVVVLAAGDAGEARARLLDAEEPAWRSLSVRGERHRLPGALALALAEAMGLSLSEEERARIAKPLVADPAAMEALWRGDAARDPARALRHYRRAVREDPESAAARNQLGTALARMGRWEEALDA